MRDLYAVPEYVLSKHIPERIAKHVEKMQPNCAFRYQKGATMTDLAKAHEIKVFDVALPVDWVREFQELTGFDPIGHFVYSYDENRYGEPVALTIDGIIAHRIYKHIAKLLTQGDRKLKG